MEFVMKSLKALTILVSLLSGSFALAAGSAPVKVSVPIDHVYSPKGFDSNDDTEVIVSGYLPDLCHKSPSARYRVDGNKIKITVEALRYADPDMACAEILVPFVESVHVGILDKGNYDIEVNAQTPFEQKSNIMINESTSNAVDDYIYANVSYVEKSFGSRTIQLKGYNPSDCLVLEGISFVSNEKDTYSVLPKMKKVSDFCPMKMTPFTYEAEVPSDIKESRVLLHVRAMDGRSVNTIFPNYSFDREE